MNKSNVVVAAGWIGLVVFLMWQEFSVEIGWRWPTVWWFRVPATIMIGLVILVFALECLLQEMRVRRWATSMVVLGVFGILFLCVGIFDPDTLDLSRWILIPVSLFYLVAAAIAGMAASDD